ncbi:DNA-J related domain-containing protein [Paraglaciecola aquimarina]|uniref:DNA-J related domain-containing protein n=1 Tax=Paraglaciecola aquimarina TaxID=1235557 RepID=A0ABU3SZ11_9ALTE|nr:DNA-J related domain-containing protein [Paraglaciecola aquimarina]MDU0355258.1 DNA-J related domain-containing protein [Paraglaciecola aquimarina]
MQKTPADWLPLQDILQNILLNCPVGLSEYDLLKLLQSAPYSVFTTQNLQQPLILFQTHFIIFNALYQVRDLWIAEQVGILHISCMSIRVEPWQPGKAGLQIQDKLREYYLNWQHLAETDQQAVKKLLDSFWQGMTSPVNRGDLTMPKEQALRVLELAEVGSGKELKKQYRKMLHKHHPDKGGCNKQTRLLHQAYESLC